MGQIGGAMLKLNFEINGRPATPENITNALEAAVLASIEQQIRSKLNGIRDPDSGEFPVVSVRGRDLDSLSIEVSGSPKLVAMVKERLGGSNEAEQGEGTGDMTENDHAAVTKTPCAFLCHSSQDKDLARQIAGDFLKQGIDAFFDEWEIGPGDSLRQKIDAGLARCSHFVALLTPNSINKPWVNAEMDAGFVKKVSGACKFIPLRYGVSVESLPPLLAALHSPELKNYDEDMKALINFIHGVTQKPRLGPPPRPIRESPTGATGLSPAAEMIAKLMIEKSEHGDSFDPQFDGDELRTATGLPDDDLVDAIDELAGRGFVRKHVTMGCGSLGFAFVTAEAALFSNLDRFFHDWDPEADALRVAAMLINEGDDSGVPQIAEKLGWAPRRMNPAVNYLIERDLIESSKSLGTHPWCTPWISKSHRTRRFVRDRS
jgi:hypothetical protein